MSGEIYGQANRYGKGIRDMSDFRSGFDDDLDMGENRSTPAVDEKPPAVDFVPPVMSVDDSTETTYTIADLEEVIRHCKIGEAPEKLRAIFNCVNGYSVHGDSLEPITAEWLESVKTNAICGFWYERDMVVWYRKRDTIEFPGCKTRGQFRELCRQLRVDLK